MKYTLVRHSAWVSANDPRFERAVETCGIHNARQGALVTKAGGVVLDYADAFKREFEENYPDRAEGIIPHVRGKFSRMMINGAQIYVPAPDPAKRHTIDVTATGDYKFRTGSGTAPGTNVFLVKLNGIHLYSFGEGDAARSFAHRLQLAIDKGERG